MCALVTARICIGGRLARVRARPSLLHERERVALKARKGKSSTRADIGRAHAPMPTPIRSACAARCLYACNSAHTDMRNNPTGRCAQLSMMRCSAGGSAPSLWARCSAVWPAPLMHQVCEPSGLRGKRRAPAPHRWDVPVCTSRRMLATCRAASCSAWAHARGASHLPPPSRS